MSRVIWIVVALVVSLMLVAGCGLTQALFPTATPPSPAILAGEATAAPTAVDTPRPQPSNMPLPKPTATGGPTLPPATSAPAPTLSADLLAEIEIIEEETEELRGLDRTLPLTRTLMTRQELTAYLEREFAEDYPPEEVEADVRVLAAFDFVSKDFDLRGLLVALYASQVLGMYDDEEDTFYIVTDEASSAAGGLGLMERLTLAHEYTHGLQDEHFGLETFTDEDLFSDDEVLARLALVEGDASLAMTEYLVAHARELTAEDYAELEGGAVEADEDVLEKAPPIIRETLEFPYIYGIEFAMVLQAEGWEAVNAAFADPPQSTEQILHPEKYLARDEPTLVTLPPLTDTLGSGWHLVEAETLGEFQTSLYLAQQVDRTTADLASEGWDGDQYAVYVKDDTDVLVLATVWDSAADRDEFVAAYSGYADSKYRQAAARSSGDSACWETPTQTTCLAWGESRVIVVLGPDPETVANVLVAIGR